MRGCIRIRKVIHPKHPDRMGGSDGVAHVLGEGESEMVMALFLGVGGGMRGGVVRVGVHALVVVMVEGGGR